MNEVMTGENICGFYQQQFAQIGGRKVFHYLITTPLNDIHLIQWEKEGFELDDYFTWSNERAEKKFKAVCKELVKAYC